MKKDVNFRGYLTFADRSRRSRRESSALLETMRAVGMSDEEIKAALLKMQAEQQPQTATEGGNEPMTTTPQVQAQPAPALSVEPPSPNAELLAAAKNALDWFSAYDDLEIICTEPEVSKPLLECGGIMTQLDSAIAAADPDWVC